MHMWFSYLNVLKGILKPLIFGVSVLLVIHCHSSLKGIFGEAYVRQVLVVSSKASDFLPVFKQINSIMLV